MEGCKEGVRKEGEVREDEGRKSEEEGGMKEEGGMIAAGLELYH